MVWVVILLVLCAVFLIVMMFFFNTAFVRQDYIDLDNLDAPCNNFLGEFRPIVQKGMDNIAKLPHDHVSTTSFDGLRLCARYYPCGKSKRTIILFHGYRSSALRDFSCAVGMYYEMGLNVLLVDQRSHGESEGKLITFGVKERQDVLSWIDYILTHYDKNTDLFLGGMSMGSTTVILAAELDLPANVKGIIADCGFSSPAEIIRKVSRQSFRIRGCIAVPTMNFLCRAIGRFSIDGISTVEALKNSKVPVLLIHGNNDKFVPVEMSEAAYEAATCEKYIYLVDGADHGFSFLVDPEGVTKQIATFLKNH